ncbi:MAG: FHA domain-containing protein [Planctomycetes bacterium]|nr:FHA domain-containing protein [Planctomycetota bacterium]
MEPLRTSSVVCPGAERWGIAGTATPFEPFASALGGLPREAFLARIVDPVLLVTRAPRAVGDASSEFSTLILRPAAPRSGGEALLVPVIKRAGANPFGMMVTVGRAGNNDLVLTDPSVSKLQCYFHRYDGRWRLSDPGSTNGTFVDGARLRRGEGVLLRPRARVQVADTYEATFLLPEDLLELVAEREAGRPFGQRAG